MSLELIEGGSSEEVGIEENSADFNDHYGQREPDHHPHFDDALLKERSEKLSHVIAHELSYSFLEEVTQVTSEVADKLTLAMNKFIEEQKLIPENLGYAIAAIKDFTRFMSIIASGKEVFHNPPPKIELSAEDVAITHDYVITLPTKLDDFRYMGEWFNKFFFPNTRPLIKTEGEMSVEGFGSEDTGEVYGVSFWFTPKEGEPFEVVSKLAGNQISLVEFANTIDTHVAD